MTRVKRGVIAHKKRESLLRHTRGFRWGRKSKERLAREAILHAWSHSYKHRRTKKRDFRRLWQIKINAAAREAGVSYSVFISGLNKKNIGLDRKVLAEIAEHHPDIFKKIAETAKK